ncbi:MAG: glycosyltransferase [Gammaproteobacteria bacterium]|nr:glycosyltransferase [Gammaproteobacteria bacterium]
MNSAMQTGTRLRVLLAMEAAGGGAARHVLDLAEGLLHRDHEVCLVYSPDRAEDWCRQAIQAMPAMTTRQLPMRRAVGADDLKLTLQLRRLIDEMGPFDILHGHSSKAGALLRLAAIGKATPCIYTPHAFITLNPDLGLAARFAYRTVERLLSYLAHVVICVSEQELQHARSMGIRARRLQMVHNGIPQLAAADRQVMRAELQLADDEFCVGFVGRLSAQKSVHRLINAFATALHNDVSLRLVIVGDGPHRAELEELARNLGIGPRVTFAGARNGVAAMAAFDIFALPSRYEAFPYVLLEAAARGLPIVMTETGGAHSVVRHEENGFVVPQDQIEFLAARLGQLAGDRKLVRRMSKCSQSVALEFSVDNMVEQTLGVYASALTLPAESIRAYQ